MDLYLKFESENQAIKTLYNTIPEEKNSKGEVVKQSSLIQKFLNIDVIGYIYKPTGKMVEYKDYTGEILLRPEIIKLDGWHVNVRIVNEDISELNPFIVNPSQPQRVWG